MSKISFSFSGIMGTCRTYIVHLVQVHIAGEDQLQINCHYIFSLRVPSYVSKELQGSLGRTVSLGSLGFLFTGFSGSHNNNGTLAYEQVPGHPKSCQHCCSWSPLLSSHWPAGSQVLLHSNCTPGTPRAAVGPTGAELDLLGLSPQGSFG